MNLNLNVIPGQGEPVSQILTPQEFSRLFTRYREPFIGIAASYIHDRTVAEDIVSDCFTRLWGKHDSLQLNTRPEAYLLTSVKNRCLNYLRDKAARMRIEQKMQDDAYKALLAEIDILDGQDMALLFRDDVQRIFGKFMQELPPMTRNIFYSSRFEDLSYAEIAEKYGITPRKVKREIQKVLEIMRTSLKEYLPLAGLLFLLYRS